jgi:hypothetical protein
MQATARTQRGGSLLTGLVRLPDGVEFCSDAGDLGRMDMLEDFLPLPHSGRGVGSEASGPGAAAQAGQCADLIPGTIDLAGEAAVAQPVTDGRPRPPQLGQALLAAQGVVAQRRGRPGGRTPRSSAWAVCAARRS